MEIDEELKIIYKMDEPFYLLLKESNENIIE